MAKPNRIPPGNAAPRFVDDLRDIRTIERIMSRTQPKPRFDWLPWIAAAIIVGLVVYIMGYDIAGAAVREIEY